MYLNDAEIRGCERVVCEEIRAQLSLYVGVTLSLCLVLFWHKKLACNDILASLVFESYFGTLGFH
jgi:hypothetical protein